MKNWIGMLTCIIGFLVSFGEPIKASAQTTTAYYQTHGAFDVEKNVVKASDWSTFIGAYRDETVTKIIMTADITDTSQDGPYLDELLICTYDGQTIVPLETKRDGQATHKHLLVLKSTTVNSSTIRRVFIMRI